MIEDIGILRSAGFFGHYKDLSDDGVYEALIAKKKKRYEEIFQGDYEPDLNFSNFELAQMDGTKVLFLDLEADVLNGNEVYVDVIKAFSELSDHQFQPTEIREVWQSDEGPIEVSFRSRGSLVTFNPQYIDDWLDESVFKACEKELKDLGIRVVLCIGDSEGEFGQEIAIVRVTEAEQKILEEKLSWEFAKG